MIAGHIDIDENTLKKQLIWRCDFELAICHGIETNPLGSKKSTNEACYFHYSSKRVLENRCRSDAAPEAWHKVFGFLKRRK